MAKRDIVDYYKRDIEKISHMLKEYTDYGYSPELAPLVEALSTCRKTLQEECDRIESATAK